LRRGERKDGRVRQFGKALLGNETRDREMLGEHFAS
jgi:hypothetical protein